MRQEIQNLGVTEVDPDQYRQTYIDSIVSELPQFVLDIKGPEGIELAADQKEKKNERKELEGDLEAFKLISDLEKEGLGEYREYLIKCGVLSPDTSAASISSMSMLIDEIFKQINSDGNARISTIEAEKILLKLNSRFGRFYGEHEVKGLFNALDSDQDGFLSLEEFKLAFANLRF